MNSRHHDTFCPKSQLFIFWTRDLFNPLRGQDHKPLIALPEMPKELQDHVVKAKPEYEEDSKVTAEFVKAYTYAKLK